MINWHGLLGLVWSHLRALSSYLLSVICYLYFDFRFNQLGLYLGLIFMFNQLSLYLLV
jgi:hypothetical protein